MSALNPSGTTLKFKDIHIREIQTILKSFKTSKSEWLDDLPARQIKDVSEQIAATFCFLANLNLQTDLFPNSETYARLIPIYKSGEKSNLIITGQCLSSMCCQKS